MNPSRPSVQSSSALVLVLQSGVTHVETLSRHLQGRFNVHGTTLLSSAREALQGRRVMAGAILDAALQDGSGFELVHELRAQAPQVPLLFVTGQLDQETVNRAHLVDVPMVARDNCAANLRHFSMQITTQIACSRESIAETLAHITHNKRLSTREAQLLAVAVHGIPRAKLARRLGISENTIKSQIRSLLDKTQKNSLSEVIWLVHSQSEVS